MELLHVHYHGKKRQQKYLLLLYLGQHLDKICGIITQEINDNDKDKIIKNRELLEKMSLEKTVEWIKINVSNAYQKGYREIYAHNLTILNRFPL